MRVPPVDGVDPDDPVAESANTSLSLDTQILHPTSHLLVLLSAALTRRRSLGRQGKSPPLNVS